MEENQNNELQKSDIDKLSITPEGHLDMLKKVVQFKVEERDMALDRYRRTDEEITTLDQLFVAGKTAISFLNAASSASNTLSDLVKEIGKIVYQTDQPTVVNNNFSAEEKKTISEDIQKILRERRNKRDGGKNKSLDAQMEEANNDEE